MNESFSPKDAITTCVKTYTYPLFILNDQGRPELVATSVAVQISGRPFLCTAAHAFHDIKRRKRPAYTASSDLVDVGEFMELDGLVKFSTNDGKVDFDICLIDAQSLTSRIEFLNSSRFALGDAFGTTSIQVLQGYPYSKNKPTKTIDPKTHSVTSALYTVGIRLDNSVNFESFRKNQSAHISFQYSSGFGEAGVVDLPYLKGMSGCGIWNVPTPAAPSTPALVGIFLEYHKKEGHCFATRAKFIKDLANL